MKIPFILTVMLFRLMAAQEQPQSLAPVWHWSMLFVIYSAKLITGDPLIGMVASVSVGVYKGTPILDLDYPEDSNADTDMNIVMDAKGFIEVQGLLRRHHLVLIH